MEITNIDRYDLTGTDPLFKREDHRFKVFVAGQKIDLEEPAYLDSIRVYKLTDDGTTKTPLEFNVNWDTMSGSCTDYNAMSEAKLRDPNWSSTHTLVNGFYMKDIVDPNPEYTISVDYQGFEKDITTYNTDSLGPDYSPGLMRSVLFKVEELFNLRSNIVDNHVAESIAKMKCLAEDLTGVAPENKVENEEHVVTNERFVIRPINGSFYNKNLEITYMPNDSTATQPLTEFTDYEVIGVNHEKTAVSEPSEGVYEFIVFKVPLNGKVFVTYQAFGGEVSQADINKLKDLVVSIYLELQNKNLVTVETLPTLELIRNTLYRIRLIEESIRMYGTQLFVYSSNQTTKWADIAFVPGNYWSETAPLPVNAVGEFRIELQELNYYLDVRVSYDTDTSALKVTVCHATAPTYEAAGVSYFIDRILPKFRVIWTNDIENGVMLQMSLTSHDVKDFHVRVMDRTGANSQWILIDNKNALRPPAMVNSIESCVFPNGVVWLSTNGGKSTDSIPVYPEGYTVFVGSIPVSEIDKVTLTHSDPVDGGLPEFVDNGYRITPLITGQDIDLRYIRAVRIKVYDRVTGQFRYGDSIKIEVDDIASTLRAAAIYFYEDMCAMEVELTMTENGYSMKLFSFTGTNSSVTDRFDLVQVDLLS